ncbi:MAG: CAP domain-containing protein [Campylobacterota bacterium]|nr:CAP domain-containing protein [Campylobacterota bacterium]
MQKIIRRNTLVGTFSFIIMLGVSSCGGGGGSSSTPTPTPMPTYSPTPTPRYSPTPTPGSFTIPPIDESTKQEYLDAVNAARMQVQDCGSEGVFDAVPALVWSDQLYSAAYEHSYDLANSNTFSHTGSGTVYDITAQELGLVGGSSMSQRIENYNYQWSTLGENIAAGYDNINTTVSLWMASDAHCANIMHPNFTEMGIGYIEKGGTDYYYYWTQNFGRPR